MRIVTLIEEGASSSDIAVARKFKKEINSSYPLKKDIYSIMNRIYKVFPDSNYNGLRVMISVPTAINLASSKFTRATMGKNFLAFSELDWQ